MVRIVEDEVKELPVKILDEQHKATLRAFGMVLTKDPKQVQHLLKTYGVRLPNSLSKPDLAEHLLDTLAENNLRFNHDLALLMLDSSLGDPFDQFDFGAIKSKVGGVLSSGMSGLSNGGLVGGIAGAVGGVSSMIGKGGQRSQASATIQQAMNSVQPDPQSPTPATGKKQMVMILSIAAGICLLGLVLFLNKNKPEQNELSHINT